MKMFLKLAIRNVFRYKRRTFITFMAISWGLGLMLLGMALYNGINRQALDNIINSQTAHLKILADGYFEKQDEFPLDLTIDNPQRIKDLLKETDELQGMEARVLFGASLINGLDELPCLGVAFEPEADPGAFNLKESIIEGSYLEASDQSALLGIGLAKDMRLKVGDTCVVRMFFSIEDFVWNALDLEIKGIVDTGNPQVDSSTIFIPLSLAQESLSLDSHATEISIRLKSEDRLVEMKESIQSKLKAISNNYDVYTYEELASDFIEFSRTRARLQAIIPLIMLLIATLGIVNTMLMAVLERIKEIGMLAAMGMKKLEVMLLFIFEGAIIGFFGSLAACLIGGLGGWYLEVKGYRLSALGLGERYAELAEAAYPVKDVFYGDITFGLLVFTLIFGTAVSILASLYPAYKAVRLDPIKALRHE
ncbi:MAG: ABC transporter permease [Candidatus Aminicenantes bacterium]|nr:MAG: ABC transporter permease [Candidatus Aminicenantes bacterium]